MTLKKSDRNILIVTGLLTAINIWLITFFGQYPQTDQQIIYYPFFAKNYIRFYILSSFFIVALILYWAIDTPRQKIKPGFRILRLVSAIVFAIVFALAAFMFPIFTSSYTHLDTETFADSTYYLGLRRETFDSLRNVYLGKCSPTKHACEFQALQITNLDYYRIPTFSLDASDQQLIISDSVVDIYTLDTNGYLCRRWDETQCQILFEQ